MKVKINGEEKELAPGTTVSQYLADNNYNPKVLVVELNMYILPKDQYDSATFAQGDEVEIVSFMGGGC